MLRSFKDRVVSKAATGKLAKKLRDFCEMFKLNVDSQAKVLIMEAMPMGEVEMVRVEVLGYRLEREEGQAVLFFDELRVSRPWMQSLLAAFLKDKKFPLPEGTPFDLIKMLI
jgi:hypothetical protein